MEKIGSKRKVYKKKKNGHILPRKIKLIILFFGLDALPGFSIKSKNWLKYKSYITFKMLENSILASKCCFLSTSHKKIIIDKYLKLLDKILVDIKNFENNKNVNILNDVPECHSGF